MKLNINKALILLIASCGITATAYAHFTYTCPSAKDFKMVKGACIAVEHNTVFYTPVNPGAKTKGTLCDDPSAKFNELTFDRKTKHKGVIVCHYDNGYQAFTKKKMKYCYSVRSEGDIWHKGTHSATCSGGPCKIKCAIKYK